MNRTVVARILKVNHGGEHGAIRIYRAQVAVAGLTAPSLLPFLLETIAHEREHEQRFRALMPARQSRPCRLMWLWGLGGTVLGVATALLGRVGIAVCTEAVERTVHRHLDEQLAYIGDTDPELSAAIREIQTQELGHLQYAKEVRGRPTWLTRSLDWSVGVVTEVLIWMSTNGDSVRMVGDLRRGRAQKRAGPFGPALSSISTSERRT